MSTWRDVITEAAVRANIVYRKKEVPADIFTTASNLLKGILQEYSNRKFITAYSNEADFVPVSESFLVGEGPDVIVQAAKIQAPQSILYRINDNEWVPLNFIAYDQFYAAGYGDYCVSWQPTGINQYKLYFRPRFVTQNRTCKLIYTLEMQFGDNDTINLPTPYVELLTRSLAYKLTVAYPRTDTTKQNSLKLELTELENMLQASNASQKIITRNLSNRGSLLGNLISGEFVFGG